ncbi:hypothetical protein Tco_0810840 [Tanacetum coccineum]
MLVPPVVVGEGLEQPPEPQPTPSTAPLEVLSQVTIATASQPPKDTNTYRRTKRGRNTKVPQSGGSPNKVGNEAINEEMFDSVERAATIASSLEAEEASVVPGAKKPWGMQAQTRSEGVSNLSSDPPLSRGHTLVSVNTPGSDEGSLELIELMDLVTKLSHRFFDLEKVKTAQAKEIVGLKRRVTKLEQRQRSRILKNHPFRFGSSRRQSLGMAFVQEKDAENQGKIGADDTEVVKGSGDTEVLDTEKAVNTAGEGVSTASVPETVSTAAPRTPPTTTTVFDDEDVTMAMAQTLIKMKEEKAKEKGVVIKDVEDSSRPVRSITTLQPLPTIDPKDKAISIVKPRTPPTTTATTFIDEDLTIARTLIKIKEEKTKDKRVAIKDVEDSPRPIKSITTLQPLPTIDPKDKGKGVLVEEELEKPEKVKRRDQRQKQEEATSAALAEEFDEIQARIDVIMNRCNTDKKSKKRMETLEDAEESRSEKENKMVIQLVLWIVDSGCSKHMTGNLQLLRNFVEKFMGTVRFGNDHFTTITGYGDYLQGNLTICHVYYVEGLEHNLFLVGQFCDEDEEIDYRFSLIKFQRKLRAQFLKIQTDTGTEFKNKKLRALLCKVRTQSKLYEFSRFIRRFTICALKTDLDNLFGPLYEEYYATSSQEVSDNSVVNTLDNENTSSSSSIIVEEDEAPQIVSSSIEQFVIEPNSPVLKANADELVQEDVAEFDGNVFYNPPQTPMFEEAESSSTL